MDLFYFIQTPDWYWIIPLSICLIAIVAILAWVIPHSNKHDRLSFPKLTAATLLAIAVSLSLGFMILLLVKAFSGELRFFNVESLQADIDPATIVLIPLIAGHGAAQGLIHAL